MHKNNKKWAINNLKFLARYVCIFSYSLLHEAFPNLSSHLELLVLWKIVYHLIVIWQKWTIFRNNKLYMKIGN